MTNNINFTANPYADLDSIDRNDVTTEFTATQRAAKLSLRSDAVASAQGSEITDAIRSLMSSGKLSFASSARTIRGLLNEQLSTDNSRCA